MGTQEIAMAGARLSVDSTSNAECIVFTLREAEKETERGNKIHDSTPCTNIHDRQN